MATLLKGAGARQAVGRALGHQAGLQLLKIVVILSARLWTKEKVAQFSGPSASKLGFVSRRRSTLPLLRCT